MGRAALRLTTLLYLMDIQVFASILLAIDLFSY